VTGHENAGHKIAGHGIAGHSLLSSVMECLICVGMLLERDRVGVSGNGVGHINKVKQRRARLVLGLVTDHLWRVYHPGTYPGHSGRFSLAIPPWVGTVSTGDGFGHRWGRKGEFCVTVSPVTRTVG